MHPLVWIGAIIGGLAFWRRKHLKEDAEKVTTAAKSAKDATTDRIAAARSGGSGEDESVETDGEDASGEDADAADSEDAGSSDD